MILNNLKNQKRFSCLNFKSFESLRMIDQFSFENSPQIVYKSPKNNLKVVSKQSSILQEQFLSHTKTEFRSFKHNFQIFPRNFG